MNMTKLTQGAQKQDAKENFKQVDFTVCVLANFRVFRLDEMIRGIESLFEEWNRKYEIIVCFGCKGEDENALRSYLQEKDRSEKLQVFKVSDRSGKAGCLQIVRQKARGQVIMTIETAGGSLDFRDIRRLIEKIDQGYDFVNGVRDWKGEPAMNRWQSQVFNWLTRKIAGGQVRDLNSTVKIFRKSVLQNIPLHGDFYRFMPLLAARRGFSVTELPLKRREEQLKATIYGPVSYVRRFLEIVNLIFITRFTEKPLRFFGGLGMGCAAAGILINLSMLVEKVLYGKGMADRPLLLLGILLIVAGIQSISIGLIGEMIIFNSTKESKSYEIERIS